MRLYSPTGLLFPRKVLKEFKAGKYTFHKGAIYMVVFTHLHLDEQYYANAKSFEQERFLDQEEQVKKTKISQACNMGFGLGKRSCIGRTLGELFIQTGIVSILKKFEFKQLNGIELSAISSVTYAPDKVYLRIKPRK